VPQPGYAPQSVRAPRDRMVVILIAIIATLVVLCLAMAVGSVYFLREEPGDDDKTSEVLILRPTGD
jgi:flagellar basal body-associated protein FliL